MSRNTENVSRRSFVKLGAAGASAVALGAMSAGAALADEGAEASDTQDAAGTPDAQASTTDTIYIVDVIHCKPGDGKDMYDHYMGDYVPGAQERGMTLVNASVNPPIWLTDEVSNNTLEFVWSVPGMMGWATMVGMSRNGDPAVRDSIIEFWRGVDDRVLSRTRTLSVPDTDVESLTTLARLGA